jgi:hypothetical protein
MELQTPNCATFSNDSASRIEVYESAESEDNEGDKHQVTATKQIYEPSEDDCPSLHRQMTDRSQSPDARGEPDQEALMLTLAPGKTHDPNLSKRLEVA